MLTLGVAAVLGFGYVVLTVDVEGCYCAVILAHICDML